MEWAFLILVLLIAFNVRGHVRAYGVRGGLTALVIVMVTAQIH